MQKQLKMEKRLNLGMGSFKLCLKVRVLPFVADFETQNFNLKTKFDMENKTSTNHENGNDANRLLCVGCRVRLTRFDAEEGFPVVNTGVVSFDWEENYYRKQIDVKLDNGEIVSMIPKWSVEVIGNHA